MPKKKDAFAFREYYKIGLELIPQSKAEMEQQETVLFGVIDKNIAYEKYSPNRLVDLKNTIDYVRNCLNRAIFLKHLTEKHLSRLEKIVKVYHQKFSSLTADVLADKILRCNSLRQKYQMILGSWQGAIAHYKWGLQENFNMLRQNALWILGGKLKTARKKAGYTMTEIAKYLNVNINTMVKYEKGDVSPPFSTVWLLAQKYEVSIDYLMTDYLEK